MTEREPTPEEEAEISRLLADAATPVTMPGQVAARLDDVLASLVAERAAGVSAAHESAGEPGGQPGDEPAVAQLAPVVPLRSRRWPKVLLAAAAVGVIAYTGANLPRLTGNGGSADSAASAESPESNKDAAGDNAGGGTAGEGAPSAPQPARLPTDESLTALEQKAATALRLKLSGTAPQPQFGADTRLLRDAVAGCVPPPAPSGTTAFEVELDSTHSVVVVLSPLSGGRARADAYPCRGPAAKVATAIVR